LLLANIVLGFFLIDAESVVYHIVVNAHTLKQSQT